MSSKKKLLLITSLSIITLIIIGSFAFLSIRNVKTNKMSNEITESSAKAFNDVKILEEVVKEDDFSGIGADLSDTDKEFLKNLGFLDEEIVNFRIYTSEEIAKLECLSDSYQKQFKNLYAGEEYYIDLKNKIIILKNSRMVEETDAILAIDDRFKEKETLAENEKNEISKSAEVKKTKVKTSNDEKEKTYVNVYVRPSNDDVSAEDELTKVKTEGEVIEDKADYTGYPKFFVSKNEEYDFNLELIVKLVPHNDMKVLEYSIGNKDNWVKYVEPFKINYNTTIYTRYSLVENPKEEDYNFGNMKTISEVKLLQTKVSLVDIKDKEEYKDYKAVIKFDSNEEEKEYIKEKFNASVSVIAKVAFIGVDEEKEEPTDTDYEDADKSDLVDKENNLLKFKAEKEGTYYLNLRTSIVSTDTSTPLYIADSKERIVKIIAENENKDDNMDDPLYKNALSEIKVQLLDENKNTYEGGQLKFIIDEKEVSEEELLEIINSAEDNIEINCVVSSECEYIKILANPVEQETTKVTGIIGERNFENNELKIEMKIESEKASKSVTFNIKREEDPIIDDYSILRVSGAKLRVSKNYIANGGTLDPGDEDYIDSSISLANYLNNEENPTFYYRLESDCDEVEVEINNKSSKISLANMEKVDAEKVKDLEKLTGKYDDLYQIEKEFNVNFNNKVCKVKIVVYKYVLKSEDKVDNNDDENKDDENGEQKEEIKKEVYFVDEGKTVYITKNQSNLIVKVKDGIEIKDLNVKETQSYTADKTVNEIFKLSSLKKSDENNSIILPITGLEYGKGEIEITYKKEDETVSTKVIIIVAPDVEVSSPINIYVGDKETINVNTNDLKDPKVSYESLNKGIATVSEKGEVTGKSVGTTSVKVKVDSSLELYKIVEDKAVEATEEDKDEKEEEEKPITESISLSRDVVINVDSVSSGGSSSGGGRRRRRI